MRRAGPQNRGFTLFELLVAVLLLAVVSTMIASVLSAGINFAGKGEQRILALEREHGFLKLLHGQVRAAHFDDRQRKMLISAGDSILRVVTREPLLYRDAGPVLAIYRYREEDGGVYYTEKRDYFNIDYDEEYLPDFDDMRYLLHAGESPGLAYDEESGAVAVRFAGREYEFSPRCGKMPEKF
jgi:prepilin-type N-terminal cleavage/methylation domain-containing protein